MEIQASQHRAACNDLVTRLQNLGQPWQPSSNSVDRLRTARAVQELVETLVNLDPLRLAQAMAQAKIETSEEAMGSSMKKAGQVLEGINRTNWALLEGLLSLTDDRKGAAQGLLTQIHDALVKDEYAVGLAATLQDGERRATRLLVPPLHPPPPKPPVPLTPTTIILARGEKSVRGRSASETVLGEIRQSFPAEDDFDLQLNWTVSKPGGKQR